MYLETSFSQENNAIKAVNHFIILASGERNIEKILTNIIKSKYSKYKVMVDQIKRLNRFFRFYFTLFGMIFTFLSTKNLKNNYFFQKTKCLYVYNILL